jgi:hypothetical protein
VATDTVIASIIAGVFGTATMDLMNLLFARRRLILQIDVAMIGRMAAGWARGRFRYGHPSEMEPVAGEKFLGYVAHHGIGVGLAIPFIFFCEYFAGGPVQPTWAIPYGLATTIASWFLVYPAMGFGVCGWRSPDGPKAIFSPLANHLFYGVGLALGLALIAW